MQHCRYACQEASQGVHWWTLPHGHASNPGTDTSFVCSLRGCLALVSCCSVKHTILGQYSTTLSADADPAYDAYVYLLKVLNAIHPAAGLKLSEQMHSPQHASQHIKQQVLAVVTACCQAQVTALEALQSTSAQQWEHTSTIR